MASRGPPWSSGSWAALTQTSITAPTQASRMISIGNPGNRNARFSIGDSFAIGVISPR